MLFNGTDIWPAIWAILGGAAALTVLLCLLVAIVPAPRLHRRARLTKTGAAPRDHAGAGRQPVAAGTYRSR